MTDIILKTSDERIKEYNEELTSKNTDITVKGVFFLIVVIFILYCVFSITSIEAVISGLYAMLLGFSAFFAKKVFGQQMKHIAELASIVYFLVFMPFLWFSYGGFYGNGNIWLIFAAMYIMFGSYGKSRTIFLIVSGLETLAIISLAYAFPDIINNAPESQQRAFCVVSIFAISAFVLFVGLKQKLLADEATIQIALMQDDLTAQNQELIAINDELIDLADKLKASNERERHFSASMNHELRAPLNGITGCLQMLLRNSNLDKEDSETVKNALISCKTIGQTVNDLLDFARLESGKFEVVKKRFDLRDLLENSLAMFSPSASAKGLEFEIHIPRSTRVSLVADPVRIQQVMTNLLSNAIKYTKSGRVTMSVNTAPCKLIFTVSDTGQGMSPEEVDVLFDAFTRFNMNQNVNIQGTGLGMNIVYNLVKEMKGTIVVDSELGVGSTFHVTIPVMFYDSDIIYSTPREKESSVSEEHRLDGLNILYVDDSKVNLTILKGLLKKCSVEVTTLDNGRKALEACAKNKYDVILLDHMMPDLNGIDTIDSLHKEGLNTDTPVVMMTGNTGREYANLYEEHGAVGYIEKPVLYDVLIETLVKACGRE